MNESVKEAVTYDMLDLVDPARSTGGLTVRGQIAMGTWTQFSPGLDQIVWMIKGEMPYAEGGFDSSW